MLRVLNTPWLMMAQSRSTSALRISGIRSRTPRFSDAVTGAPTWSRSSASRQNPTRLPNSRKE